MKIANYNLSGDDSVDFEEIFKKLKLPIELLPSSLEGAKKSIDIALTKYSETYAPESPEIDVNESKNGDSVPSILNFTQFKLWMINALDEIENLTDVNSLGKNSIRLSESKKKEIQS